VSKRVFHYLSLLLGIVGLVACIATIVGIWIVCARVNQVTENVFSAIDESLVVVRRRVLQTQDRVQSLKTTAEDVEHRVTDWTKSETREQLTSRLGVQERAERLASGFEQADLWLELTQSSVQLVQQALAASSSGVPIQTDSADRLLEDLASLRQQLAEATKSVNRIVEWSSEGDDDELNEARLNHVAQVAVRVLASVSSIDSRIENLGERLTEIQAETGSVKANSLWWIRMTAIGITLLVCWLAAGQGALCVLGWKGLHPR